MKAKKLILFPMLPLLFIPLAFLLFRLGAGFEMIVIPAAVFALFVLYARSRKLEAITSFLRNHFCISFDLFLHCNAALLFKNRT